MDTPAPTGTQAALGDYLAAERTLLAWIRTGLALMGFGFVVARFGLFLRELDVDQRALPLPSHGLSPWFGTLLIAAGVLVNVVAGWRHLRLARELDHGDTGLSRSSTPAVAIAFFLALVGLAMASYLVSIQGPIQTQAQRRKEIPMSLNENNGIVEIPSNHSVDQTVATVKQILEAQGVTLFAQIDHSGEAEKVGMKMPATKLLIFGNPKAGTPVMLAAPASAIDLPLKLLIREDAQGKVWVTYNSPEYLRRRHDLPQNLLQNIAVVEALARRAGA